MTYGGDIIHSSGRTFYHNNNIPKASLTLEGIVKLNNTVTSTSTSLGATANSVKLAYDKGNHAHPYLPTAGGTMTGNTVVNNYGIGNVGLYSASRYQNVFSMGASYVPSANGTSLGNMYGIA